MCVRSGNNSGDSQLEANYHLIGGTMKKLLSLFFAISLTLSACGAASTPPTPPAQTGTPTITPTVTQMPTANITPLPTIPTITPTFDVSTIVTVTPAEKAECPKEDFAIAPIFLNQCKDAHCDDPNDLLASPLLNYLNAGGTIQELAVKLKEYHGLNSPGRFGEISEALQVTDLTGDGVPEIAFVHFLWEGLIVYGCHQGKYEILFTKRPDIFAQGLRIQDLNANGIPEIILDEPNRGYTAAISIYEWDGDNFVSLVKAFYNGYEQEEFIAPNIVQSISYIDKEKNGTIEIVINQGKPAKIDFVAKGLPWRDKTTTLSWNGKNFVITNDEYTTPEYRFQSIQDADIAVSEQKYERAIGLYIQAISNKNLEWFSLDRKLYLKNTKFREDSPDFFTPAPLPPIDPAEYPSLAAYAYYRIMLLHLVQGQEAEAASTFQTLQDTFGTDPYAAPYIEMTTEFWEAYQSTQEMYDGCAAAIQYAVEHPEILTPLGSDYHGWQSHIYVPADVCPFR